MIQKCCSYLLYVSLDSYEPLLKTFYSSSEFLIQNKIKNITEKEVTRQRSKIERRIISNKRADITVPSKRKKERRREEIQIR